MKWTASLPVYANSTFEMESDTKPTPEEFMCEAQSTDGCLCYHCAKILETDLEIDTDFDLGSDEIYGEEE